MPKTRILTFVSAYLPGYRAGGQIQSVANIADKLGREFAFKVVTRDRDAGDAVRYAEVSVGEWTRVGLASVFYLAPSMQTFSGIANVMRSVPHDAIYLNSFFHYKFATVPLLAQYWGVAPRRPVILAPRGEFSPGALRISPVKKRAFIAVTQAFGLHRHVRWHASNEHEAEDICRVMGVKATIHIASNLPRTLVGQPPHNERPRDAPLRISFVSRISTKKNLAFAIDVLSQLTIPVNFEIVGLVDDVNYWEICRKKIAELPSHIRVRYRGSLPASDIAGAVAKSDLFFLPTWGENFGHVIIEALGAGTPVLISDQTPWQDLERAGCGWVLPLDDLTPYAAVIEEVFYASDELTERRRAAACEYAQRFASQPDLVEANRQLFSSVSS